MELKGLTPRATPLLGWLTVSALGQSVALRSWPLPLLLAKNDALRRRLQNTHETIANIGYAVIAVHVLAALYHHCVRRDNTMALMWPARLRAAARFRP